MTLKIIKKYFTTQKHLNSISIYKCISSFLLKIKFSENDVPMWLEKWSYFSIFMGQNSFSCISCKFVLFRTVDIFTGKQDKNTKYDNKQLEPLDYITEVLLCMFTCAFTAHWLCCVLVEMTLAGHVKILVTGVSVGVSIFFPLCSFLLPPPLLFNPSSCCHGRGAANLSRHRDTFFSPALRRHRAVPAL